MKPIIEIKISGPGQTFVTELALIEKVFLEAGIPVVIVDEYPHREGYDPLSDAALKNLKRGNGVRIVTNHCPWGG